MFEISVQTTFPAAHALRLPAGRLEPLHGHNWHVTVSVAGRELDDIETLMDFHELERILTGIIQPLHNRNLNDIEPFATRINPTAERVAWWIGTETASHLPEHVHVRYVSVTEAPNCTATWWASA